MTTLARPFDQAAESGVQRWMRPALDLLRSLPSHAEAGLRGALARDRPVYVGRAPGRLDVMGGIADYSGATVLQLPLDLATFALAQESDTGRCELTTLRHGRVETFAVEMATLLDPGLASPESLAEWLAGRQGRGWPQYLLGVVHACLRRLPPERPRGLRLLVHSQVPEGKGVSSSAALEVAGMAAVAACYGMEIGSAELAAECQRVENRVVGAPCGIMDQMVSTCGQQDRLLRLRCQPAVVEGFLDVPAGYRFFGIDSGIRHAVSGTGYGLVRTAAFMGYRIIADLAGLRVERDGERVRVDDPEWGGYLANVPPDEFRARFEAALPEWMDGGAFLARYGGTTDPVTLVHPDRRYPVRPATAHPVYEQARIVRFVELMRQLPRRPGAAREMGELMYLSHASYGACGLGSEGTDLLVTLVREAGPGAGLFGAKLTGGGSGGTVVVLGAASAEARVREIAARYAAETGRAVNVFTGSGPGAAATGTVLIPAGAW